MNLAYHLSTFLLLFIIFLFNNFLSKKLNIYDFKDEKRKIHKMPVSKIGGIYFFTMFVFYHLYEFFFLKKMITYQDSKFILLLSIIFFIGLIDDIKNLSSNKKLIFFFIITIIFLVFNENYIIEIIKSDLFSIIFQKKIYALFFTSICILLFINAFNMIDGINTLASGYIFILIIYILNPFYQNELLLTIFFTNILFIVLNYQNKIFLGNSGSYFLSTFISLEIIKSYKIETINRVDEIFFIMSIIGFDLLRLAIERIINKKHPFKADNNHLHHYILLYSKNHFHASLKYLLIISLPYLLYKSGVTTFVVYVFALLFYVFVLFFFKRKLKNKFF